MGGEYCGEIVSDMSKDDLKEAHRKIHEECLYAYGHSGYSGTFAEKPELVILPAVYKTDGEARELCLTNDKWGPAWAVRVEKPEPHWYIGGWCSS